uniref:Uncharacterized protein n=2 Tax=Strongyloides stercoralis TaxID=6248 RepID=A0AAF5DAM9_STRER
MSHGTTSLNESSCITELPDILNNLLNALDNEIEVSNEFLVEIEINIKKKETEKDDCYYEDNFTDKSTKKKKNKKHKKKQKKNYSKLSKRKYKNYRNRKNQDTEENSQCYTLCKTLRTRSKGEKSDDDTFDCDDRYPDESLENLPYLNDSQRQLLKALRREQMKKCNKKDKLKIKEHIESSLNPDEDYKESSYQSKSSLISKPSSFSRHYPYVPRISRKKNKKAKIRTTEYVDSEENSDDKEISRNTSSKKKINKEKNKYEKNHYVNSEDVMEDNNIEKIPMRNKNISKDMYKIFK